MADQPRSDDDESTAVPEVTVPPWLRSGPTPAPTNPAPDVPAGPEPGPGRDERRAPGPGASEKTAPHRITLGARTPEESPQDRDAPRRPPDDDLSTLPLRSAESQHEPGAALVDDPARDPTSDRASRPTSDRTSGPATASTGILPRLTGSRGGRIGLFAVAGAAVLAGSGVFGFVLTSGVAAGSGAGATDCAAVEEPGRVVGSGPGSLETPAGAVLAFDHAYYAERSAQKAFEAVSPESRMTEARLRQEGVEQVAEGTTHCVDVTEISPTLLEVTLTESPPDAEPVEIRQRVRVEESPDGTWGIVSITPAA